MKTTAKNPAVINVCLKEGKMIRYLEILHPFSNDVLYCQYEDNYVCTLYSASNISCIYPLAIIIIIALSLSLTRPPSFP